MTNQLAAYLYLHLAEPMPEPVEDVAADNAAIHAWATGCDRLDLDPARLARFEQETAQLLEQLTQLELDPAEPAAPQYMTLFYDAAKRTFDYDKTQLRTYFLWLYLVLFQKPDGPRWGDFVEIYGVQEFVAFARNRMENLI